jgi:hypothetical protein
MQVQARNLILFSRREAARTGIRLPASDSRAEHIRSHLKSQPGDLVRVGVVNGLKVCRHRAPRARWCCTLLRHR